MSHNMQELLDRYFDWIKDKTVPRYDLEGWAEITTPFLDRHNDQLQIYVRKSNGGYELTDDGYIIKDLEASGCILDTPKRKNILKKTLAGFGVEQSPGNRLGVKSTLENFPRKKHNLLQAMLAVNDLFYLTSPIVQNLFFEDVNAWLDHNHIRYTPNCKFSGKSGYDHLFDFVIPRSTNQPERILQVINDPTKSTVESLVFKWVDTKETRPKNSKLYTILNDKKNENNISAASSALSNYGIIPAKWSGIAHYKEELVA